MSDLPKIKVIRPAGYPSGEIRELEQARYFLFSYGSGTIVVIDGQVVNSYEELVQLASQEHYRDREFLEAMVAPLFSGG
jgi:hypothetical protein